MKTIICIIAAILLAAPVHAHDKVAGEHEAHATPKRAWFHRWFHRHRDAPQWDGVNPELRHRLEAIQGVMRDEGFDLRLMEGFRSDARQAQLLASGHGVTQVGPGRSCHNHGFAADMVVFVRNRPSWDLTNPHVREGYARFGALATEAGLRWGGAWVDFQDMPHVEMRDECLLAMRSLRQGETKPAWVDLPTPFEVWPGVSWAMSTTRPGCTGLGCFSGWAFPDPEATAQPFSKPLLPAWGTPVTLPAACPVEGALASVWAT